MFQVFKPDAGPASINAKNPFMTKTARKIFAVLLLFLLIFLPFINWKLGALLWMCAWLTFILQNLYVRRNWKLGEDAEEMNEDEEQNEQE